MQAYLLLFAGVLSGPLIDAGYMRHTLVLGTVLIIFGLMMTSLCIQYWQFMLPQGIVTGIGAGLIFLPSITVVPQYYGPAHRSLALGLVATGSSVGGMIFSIALHYLLTSVGFPWSVRIIAFIILGTQIPGLILLRMRNTPASRRAFLNTSMFAEPAYTLLCLALFIGFMGLYGPMFYIQSYALSATSIPPLLAFYLLPILMLGSAPGRVLPNLLADKIGPFNVFVPMTLLCAVLVLSWIGIRSVGGLVFFAILYGFASGSFVSLTPPAIVATAKGMDGLGTRMGMALAIASFGLVLGNPVAGALLGNRGSRYLGLQVFCGATLIVCAGLLGAVRYLKVGLNVEVKV